MSADKEKLRMWSSLVARLLSNECWHLHLRLPVKPLLENFL